MKKYLILLVPVLMLLGSVQIASATPLSFGESLFAPDGKPYWYTVVYNERPYIGWQDADLEAMDKGGWLVPVKKEILQIKQLLKDAKVVEGLYAIAGKVGIWDNNAIDAFDCSVDPAFPAYSDSFYTAKLLNGYVMKSVPDASIMLLLGPSLLGLGLLARRKFEK